MTNRAAILSLSLMLICFPAGPAAGQELASWIRYSDSGDNAMIVEMIRQGDLTTALDISAALGLRQDPKIGEIVLAVGETSDRRSRWERELILRTMLDSVFSASLAEAELADRLQINSEAVEFLVANLGGYTSSLKREVIRLLGYHRTRESSSVLMSEGRRLSDLLTLQRGDLNGEQAGLTLTYLETIRRLADPDFAEIVLMILERSRHLEVAEKARSVSLSLLLGG